MSWNETDEIVNPNPVPYWLINSRIPSNSPLVSFDKETFEEEISQNPSSSAPSAVLESVITPTQDNEPLQPTIPADVANLVQEINFDTILVNQPVVNLPKLPSVQPVFVQPPVIPFFGAVTRRTAINNYDDTDEAQNELIGMERGWVDASDGSLIQGAMPKSKKLEIFQEACRISKLPPPLPFQTFEAMDWCHVSTFDRTELLRGHQFSTLIELAAIPRRHGKFPFCHPGPVADTVSGTRDWFYADSIVQEVKLIKSKQPHFVVRWVGYEDE